MMFPTAGLAAQSLTITALLLLVGNIRADEKPAADAAAETKTAAEDKPVDNLTVTKHQAEIGGNTIDYSVTAGTLVMRTDEAKSKAKASIFFIAYTRNGVKDLGQRPVTFCFNGGPGSSSVWLHLGMLAPWRVPMNEDATATAPPYRLVPNTESMLDKTDLVFIDPVSTGYSRPAAGEDKQQFHGYDEDIQSVGQFIHLYTTRYNRWQSSRFLLGESYGTLRAAGLSGHLLTRYNMEVNGIILISSTLDFATLTFTENNDLPYILFLPTYTATAWYHKRLAADLQRDFKKTLADVGQFATTEYAAALFKGDALSDAQRQLIAQKLARYTGLSPEMIERSNLRIHISKFTKNLLFENRKTVGRFDSRYVGVTRDPGSEWSDYDPSAAAIFAPFTATLYHYLHNDLKIQRDVPYEILTHNVNPWNYKRFNNGYVNALDTLNKTMTENPHMKVFVANGYYDLATPYLATEYTFDHLALGAELRKNVTMSYYDAGHMMYVHGPSLKKLKKDLTKFYDNATGH
ncbi:MAG: peptidase S10 [Planctomycetota bacterium]|nr:peptidase S10 [Planctomycetota bacterium]